jgi:S-adenosylmethionine decarboxylase
VNQEAFGPHLAMDLWGCPHDKLSDLRLHFDFLNEIPDIIGMTKITQPYVFPYQGLVPTDAGVTGIIIIAESHLSIHSFEHKGHTFLDIFSCKTFDTERVIKEAIQRFKPSHHDLWINQRGRCFPR